MVKLFVGGFPLDISEMGLVKLFGIHGDVVTIKIVRNKKTGTCKGYAFLEMKNQESADRAVGALDNAQMEDRVLTVRIVEQTAASRVAPVLSDSLELSRIYIKVERPSEMAKKKRPRRQA